jgi:hypothetical protein
MVGIPLTGLIRHIIMPRHGFSTSFVVIFANIIIGGGFSIFIVVLFQFVLEGFKS